MPLLYDISRLAPDIQNLILTSGKYTKWFSEFPQKLLQVNGDAKTVKGVKKKVLTAILYLAPAKISGYNMCPMAELAKCDGPCLNLAGRGQMKSVQLSRIRKTLYFMQFRDQFLEQLWGECVTHANAADRLGYEPAIRLNGTSDNRWEVFWWDAMVDLHEEHGIKFYDYTKIPNRNVPDKNVYDLTFSYSGVSDFKTNVRKAMDANMRMAVVVRERGVIPESIFGMSCVNGDEDDIRYRDPDGVAVILYAKGSATRDTSGFVVDLTKGK
jgi:hypothetical protein